jgi:hypothetical protein
MRLSGYTVCPRATPQPARVSKNLSLRLSNQASVHQNAAAEFSTCLNFFLHHTLLTRHLHPPTAKWTLLTQHRASALSFVPARHASSLLRLAARPWLHISRVGFGGFCTPQTRTLLVATEAGRSRPIPSGRVCTVAGKTADPVMAAIARDACSSWPGTSTEGRPSNAKQAHLSRDRRACLMDDHARGRNHSRHGDD